MKRLFKGLLRILSYLLAIAAFCAVYVLICFISYTCMVAVFIVVGVVIGTVYVVS
jgi:hypothetical protein